MTAQTVSFSAKAGQTTFSTPFPVNSTADAVVTVNGSSAAFTASGFSIVLSSAVATDGHLVVIAQPYATQQLQGTALGVGFSASVSQTRPNDTSAYTARDVIGTSTSTTAALEFAGMAPPGGGKIMITSARLSVNASTKPSGMGTFFLALYSATPASALGDNAAWDIPSGDRATFLGKLALGSPEDEGSTLFIETDGLNKQITLTGSSLFAYLVTEGGFTPTAQTVKKIDLSAVFLGGS